jgi:glycosyltransferase involved in cell wall biosynthesis
MHAFGKVARDWLVGLNPFDNARTTGNILYTAIFNPKDGRKNWEDIITAFVYAFRDDSGATLLIKITYHELAELYEDIFMYLIELYPFKCRLVFIHGFLSGEQYEQLLLHSHFIVNASRGEGQCLPLMEFMSAGVPAVAPCNTAMSEYINPTNAFIVESSPELTFWPQDPRQVFRTLWQRIDWESLVQAFAASAILYRSSPDRYRQMADAAVQSQRQYCSMGVARERFEHVLHGLQAGADR